MSFEEFCNYMLEHLRDYLPEELRNATIERFDKSLINGGTGVGIVIREPDKDMAPCFYVNDAFKEYQNGMPLGELCEKLIDGYMEHRDVKAPIVPDNIFDFAQVKDQILPRMINLKQNRELLGERPYTRVDDLAVVYMVDLPDFGDCGASMPITNSIFEKWQISIEELHTAAIQNAVTREGYILHDIRAMILGDMTMNFLNNDIPGLDAKDAPMLVLTTPSQIDGATALANPDILMAVGRAVQGDYYILPSSTDELLVVTKENARENGSTPKTLGEMVRNVNQQAVEDTKRLSDHIYEFNMESRELRTVPESREKVREAER